MAFAWYILKVDSNSEKRVAKIINEQAVKYSLAESFNKVIIPSESVTEVKKGKKVPVDKKFFPGYILLNMELNDNTWHMIKNVPHVRGFLGSNNKPRPISDEEAEAILKQMEQGSVIARKSVTFEVGENVKVISGPFESFTGIVEEVDLDKSRLKVSVSIFGRSTSVDLDFNQVAKT